jgi:alpha-L-arabinofuranosidase
VKDAVSFIGKFEAAVAHYAKRYHVDAVLCGHIHSAAIREFGKVTYYNCGDWVESCTALVEEADGILSLVNYHPFSAVRPVENRRHVGRNEEIRMTNVERMSRAFDNS